VRPRGRRSNAAKLSVWSAGSSSPSEFQLTSVAFAPVRLDGSSASGSGKRLGGRSAKRSGSAKRARKELQADIEDATQSVLFE
jgi:hypothetical protein